MSQSDVYSYMSLKYSTSQIILLLRKEAGLSQEKLAEKAGVHRTYISQLERGIKSPTIPILFKLAQGLNTKPSDIISLIEEINDGI